MPQLSPPIRIFALVAALVGGRRRARDVHARARLGRADRRRAAARAPAGCTEAGSAKTPAPKAAPEAAGQGGAAREAAAKPKPRPARSAAEEPAARAERLPRSRRRRPALTRGRRRLALRPGARVDQLATDEARAGAALGGAGFVALNVLEEKTAKPLLEKLGTLEDPSLLVSSGPARSHCG